MPDFPLAVRLTNAIAIGPFSQESIIAIIEGNVASISASFTWPTSNLAIFFPFEIYEPITIAKLTVLNGSAVSGNIDAGIYDAMGNRLVSIGSTAQSGTTAIQTFDVTDTLLVPGLYYLALALDNTTGTVGGYSGLIAGDMQAAGCFQQASAFPLPNPATFAAFAQTVLPLVTAHRKTTI